MCQSPYYGTPRAFIMSSLHTIPNEFMDTAPSADAGSVITQSILFAEQFPETSQGDDVSISSIVRP